MQVRTLLGTVAASLCVLGLGCRDDQTREKAQVESAAVVEQDSAARNLVEDDTTPGVCELHQIPYAEEVIRVHYGFPALRELTEEQRRWLHKEQLAWSSGFRYSHVANKAGGCVVREAKFAKVSYCPECRKADEEWHAKHGRSPLARNSD
jgi:hypothetical protein